jgi:hypothetical protein
VATVTAVGPALPVVGPSPEPREYSLIETLRALDRELFAEDRDERWLNQVNVIGYPMGTPGVWEACSTGTFRVKDDGSGENDGRPQDRWDPFAAFFPLLCSAISVGNFDEFYDQAEAALDATLSHAVEDVLSQGVGSNPYFGDADLAVLTSGAVNPRVGLSYLENGGAVRTGRQFMIHATPAVISAWGDGGGLSTEGGVLRTVNGTPVVSGSGYIGAHPISQPGPDDTTDWAFATGPVVVRIDHEVRKRIEESLDRQDNTVVVRAERYVVAVWDKALQIGVQIDWAT